MEYFCLVVDDHSDSPYWNLCIDEARLESSGGDIWAYSAGTPIEDACEVPCLVDQPGLSADFNMDGLTAVPIVSSRLAGVLLELAPSNIQLISANLNARGEWKVVNVVSLVDAFDDCNSIASRSDDERSALRGVMRLIVDPSKIGSQHLFRLSATTNDIIVSETLMRRCQDSAFTNMKFVPATLDAWNSYVQDTKDDRWCLRLWK